MKAPDKIWLQWQGREWEYDITWCQDKINDNDTKYIRYDKVVEIFTETVDQYFSETKRHAVIMKKLFVKKLEQK